MRYTPKPVILEAVLLDSIKTALAFLEFGEFSVLQRDGIYIVLPDKTTIFAPFHECYLIRSDNGLDIMDKDEFETNYQEAR